MDSKFKILITLFLLIFSSSSMASSYTPDTMTSTGLGIACVIFFIIAYFFVITEEKFKIKKSKPVLFAAGLIWILVGIAYHAMGKPEIAQKALEGNFLEYAELFLFLLVAMTYINAMEERRIFDALKSWLVSEGFKYKTLYWITGLLAFFISPVADNLTTALLMCTIVMKVGENNKKFITLCCINIVIGANAGGAFSPFGDITTLMVWQTGKVEFAQFFDLFIPAAVNFLVPGLIMSFFLPKGTPDIVHEHVEMKPGALRIVGLFLLTVITAVCFHLYLDFPPVVGMMFGLAYLQLFGFYLRVSLPKFVKKRAAIAKAQKDEETLRRLGGVVPFDVFQRIAQAEWDTLLFFYGVVMCVGGLSLLGYLGLVSHVLYTEWGAIPANITIGILSSIVDNIPVMYAVLTMNPLMSHGDWLLVTLTAGVGGSLLSIGSAAGVALMGAAKGNYTFASHLKWTPVVAVGYAASILCHIWLNSALFSM